jgi:hypothetical protein
MYGRETATIMPIPGITAIARDAGIAFHTDTTRRGDGGDALQPTYSRKALNTRSINDLSSLRIDSSSPLSR